MNFANDILACGNWYSITTTKRSAMSFVLGMSLFYKMRLHNDFTTMIACHYIADAIIEKKPINYFQNFDNEKIQLNRFNKIIESILLDDPYIPNYLSIFDETGLENDYIRKIMIIISIHHNTYIYNPISVIIAVINKSYIVKKWIDDVLEYIKDDYFFELKHFQVKSHENFLLLIDYKSSKQTDVPFISPRSSLLLSFKDKNCYRCRDNNLNISIKAIDKFNSIREITALRKIVGYKGIIKLHDFKIDYDQGIISTQLGTKTIKGQNHVSIFYKLKWIKSIMEGLLVMHHHHMIHCDIKPSNIILTDDGNAVIANFGSVDFYCNVLTLRSPKIGTINYQDYNLLIHRKKSQVIHCGYEIDIWSLACVILELMTGIYPYFQASTELELINEIELKLFQNEPFQDIENLQLRDLIILMLEIKPFNRINIRECLSLMKKI